jgi:DNA-binding MarR family transcriptional regulator
MMNEVKLVKSGLEEVLIKVPESEYLILCVLNIIGKSHAPAISRASKGGIPVGGVYNLLKRLEQRGLVTREEGLIPFGDVNIRRVLYSISENVLLPNVTVKYGASTNGKCETVNEREVMENF